VAVGFQPIVRVFAVGESQSGTADLKRNILLRVFVTVGKPTCLKSWRVRLGFSGFSASDLVGFSLFGFATFGSGSMALSYFLKYLR
jgi:hypothetical protein